MFSLFVCVEEYMRLVLDCCVAMSVSVGIRSLLYFPSGPF